MIASRLGLSGTSRVIELGSNDGYLLQYFVAKGMPVLGVEPARNVAEAAVARGVPTHRSEERRVGKECRSGWMRDQSTKKAVIAFGYAEWQTCQSPSRLCSIVIE